MTETIIMFYSMYIVNKAMQNYWMFW